MFKHAWNATRQLKPLIKMQYLAQYEKSYVPGPSATGALVSLIFFLDSAARYSLDFSGPSVVTGSVSMDDLCKRVLKINYCIALIKRLGLYQWQHYVRDICPSLIFVLLPLPQIWVKPRKAVIFPTDTKCSKLMTSWGSCPHSKKGLAPPCQKKRKKRKKERRGKKRKKKERKKKERKKKKKRKKKEQNWLVPPLTSMVYLLTYTIVIWRTTGFSCHSSKGINRLISIIKYC